MKKMMSEERGLCRGGLTIKRKRTQGSRCQLEIGMQLWRGDLVLLRLCIQVTPLFQFLGIALNNR